MINIDLERTDTGSFYVRMKGHAGAGPIGQDMVCCAVSTLAQVFAQWVMCNYAQGMLRREPVIKLKPGDIYIALSPKPDAAEETEHVYSFLMIGCWMLRENYKKFITLNVFGEEMNHCINADDTSGQDQEGEQTNEEQF